MDLNNILLFAATLSGFVYVLVQQAKNLGVAEGKPVQIARLAAAMLVAAGWKAYQVYPALIGPYVEWGVMVLALVGGSALVRTGVKDKKVSEALPDTAKKAK